MGLDHPRTLIAIINARHRADWREKIRKSWLSQVPRAADAYFFVGRGTSGFDNEGAVELDCPDDYQSIPEKVRAIARWAREREYEFMLKCDDDVILKPNDFLASGYDKYPYSGRANRPPQPYTVPYGFGYVIDKRCMGIIADSPLPTQHPEPFDDERWVAETLWNQNIPLADVRRYVLYHRVGYQLPKDAFAACIHLAEPQAVKLREYDIAFGTFGEGMNADSLAVRNARELIKAFPKYSRDGCTINWWDTH